MTRGKTQRDPKPQRSASEKRKPSSSPTDTLPPKSHKPLVQSTLNLSVPREFTFTGNSTPSSPGSRDSTLFSSTPVPDTQASMEQDKDAGTPPFLSPSMFTFINDASADVLTSKLSGALMLPQLQKKFQETFMKVATELISEHMKTMIVPLKQEIKELRAELHQKTDELEQYSRRNSLRIVGIPEKEKEHTGKVTIELLKKIHPALSPADIDRCHRVGKRIPGRQRQIIIKFVSYYDRNAVITNRRQLGAMYPGTYYINEDLTRYRSKLYKMARDLVTKRKIKSTRTRDGRIYVQENHDGPSRLISTESDLYKY